MGESENQNMKKISNVQKIPNIFGRDFGSSNSSSLKNTNLINYMTFNNNQMSKNITVDHLKDRSAFKRVNKTTNSHFRTIKSPKSEYNFYHHKQNKSNTILGPQKDISSPLVSVNNEFKDDNQNIFGLVGRIKEDFSKTNVFYQNSSNNVPSQNNYKSSILSFKDKDDDFIYQNFNKGGSKDPFQGLPNIKLIQPIRKPENYSPYNSVNENSFIFNTGVDTPNQNFKYNIKNLGNLQQNIKFDISKQDVRKSQQPRTILPEFQQIISKKEFRPSNKSKNDEYLNLNNNEKYRQFRDSIRNRAGIKYI